MRQPIIAGNWKMHGTQQSVAALLTGLLANSQAAPKVQLAVFPPAVFIDQVAKALTDSPIAWGGQNVCAHVSGAFTGEISSAMWLEFGCQYVITGHSERRTIYKEDDARVAAKFIAASKAGLRPIICVGENQAEREAGHMLVVVRMQLDALLQQPEGLLAIKNGIIAYEPLWAIGTGLTATPEEAQSVHKAIREHVAGYDTSIAESLQILYGGSIKRANAKALFAMLDIDGGLIGGASLEADEFLEIAQLCNNLY